MSGLQTAGGMSSGAAGTGSIDAAEQERKVSAKDRNLGIQKNMDSFEFDSDDGESDFDGAPEALLSSETPTHQRGLEAFTQNFDLSVFFQGVKYRTMSLIFGPMACFFLIA